MSVPWRLIVDGADDGAWNMAVDEAILERYAAHDEGQPPTLRLYGWEPATISLGRSQPEERTYHRAFATREGIGVVRRPSGGSAVLHEFERTYAVVGTLSSPPFSSGVVATYRAIAGALAHGLKRLGIGAEAVASRRGVRGAVEAVCAERLGDWEIAVAGRKLIGSAQARRRRAVLQHGSIPLRLTVARLESVFGTAVDGSRFVDLEQAAGRAIDPAALDAACIRGFEETFRARLVPGALDEAEALRASELRCWKYDSVAWTRGGVIGSREARWGPALSR